MTHREPPKEPLPAERARGILNHLLSDLPGVVYRCRDDEAWTMLGLTANVEELTGWTVGELVGNAQRPFEELIHLDDRDHVREQVRGAVEEDEPFRVVYRIETKGGEERWILEQGRAVEEDGERILTGYLQDVTDSWGQRLRKTHQELEEVRQETRRLKLLHSVTQIVNRERTPEAALAAVLPQVCEAFSFAAGHVFLQDEDGDGNGPDLRSSGLWHLEGDPAELQRFVEATDGPHWDPREGLPGRVMRAGRAEWVESLERDPSFSRIDEDDAVPLKSGVGVPVVSGERTLAVMEFFSDHAREPDPPVMELLEQVGIQLGRVWERQEADRQEQVRRQLFHQLAQRDDMVFWVSDLDGDILYLSPGIEELLGREPGSGVELRGSGDLVAMTHPEDRERVGELFSRPDRAPYDIEYRIVTADDRVRWLHQRAFPIQDADGRPFRIGGLAEDITEARRSRERLEETTRLLEQTFSSLGEAVLIIDTSAGEGRGILEVNDAAERIFGWSRDELVGGTTETLHVDRKAFERFAKENNPVLAREGVVRARFPMRRKDGTTFPAEQTVTLLDPERGLPGGAVSVVRDVSERTRAQEALRRTEEHYRTLIENSADVIAILDEELITRYVSPSIEDVLGYTPAEVVGSSGRMRVHPDDREEALARRRSLLERPGKVITESYRMIHRDGSVRHVESRAQNLLQDPSVAGVVVNLRDVTQQRELERQLLQAQKMEAVGRLAGGIAHDFNNLLTVIRGQADFLLLDMASGSPLAQEIRVVRDAADRAAQLTNQLLAFGREQVLRPRVVMLGDVVVGMEALLRRVLSEDIRIETRTTPDLPPVRVDPGQLEQVVMNLALNARDAMPHGGTLTLSTSREELSTEESKGLPELEPGPVVRLRVRDTGIGMNEAIRNQIFEPFFTTKSAEGGTGLGLSMTYGIVKQSGGAISVESAPGEGTTFTLTFPASDEPAEHLPQAEEDEPTRPDGLRGTVLVVEDDASVLRVARRILERAGMEVHTAGDTEEARRQLEHHGEELDVLLTDLVLPGAGGRSLVDWALEALPNLGVVVMSGYAEGSPGKREDLPAQVAFIQKPFSPDRLAGVVRSKLPHD